MTRRIRRARRDYRARKLGQWEKYGTRRSPGLQSSMTISVYGHDVYGSSSRWQEREDKATFLSVDTVAHENTLSSMPLCSLRLLLTSVSVVYIRKCTSSKQYRQRERERERGETYPTNV